MAQVRETFKTPKFGTIAGCMVTEGSIKRSGDAQARLLRDNVVVFEGKIGSLRRFKDDVSEVKSGFECGIGFEKYNDLKVGDVIEAFVVERVATPVRKTASQYGELTSGARRRSDPRRDHGDAEPAGARSGHRLPDRDARRGLAPTSSTRVSTTPRWATRRPVASRHGRWSARLRSFAVSSAGRLRLRRAPELQFFYDESIERHDRIERILREIEQERAQRPSPLSSERQ